MQLDKDLASIQEVRNLIANAKAAAKAIAGYDQVKIDSIVKAIADACTAKAAILGKMAAEETGFGIPEDKALKNLLASKSVYEFCKDMKTIGVIRRDEEKKIIEVAVPMGVVAAIIPSTNPTSTTIYKAIISIKAGNAVVVSPHPNAKKCILETVSIIRDALKNVGVPQDLVQCISIPTIEATNALMRHKDIGIILATGGPGMVKAAYSSGNPALGVGAGNGPAFIERSADISQAVKRIIDSKTFDNGTICASEQSIITERCINDCVKREFQRQGCYFLDPGESEKVAAILLNSNGSMNPAIVGKNAQVIAAMAGMTVPEGTRVLLSEQTEVSHQNPYSREKLCTVLGYYIVENWEEACELSIAILNNEGIGHTMTIHSKNEKVICEFALKKPVMRLLVNTAAALGGVGASTALAPSLTLGCGADGGSATSDNVTPMNLLNIRRVAWGIREVEELRGSAPAPRMKGQPDPIQRGQFTREDVQKIALEVMKQLNAK